MDKILETITQIQDVADDCILQYFRKPFVIDEKSDASPVTIADRETERKIRAIITTRHRDDAIIGEEFPDITGSGDQWVIDPIDGTLSFVYGNPLFGSLIGVIRDDRVIAGGMTVPATRERWLATHDSLTLHNNSVCQTSTCDLLKNARIAATSPQFFPASGFDSFTRFMALADACHYLRFGGDCYLYGLLANGTLEIVCETGLKPYDILPLVPLIEQAGGIVSDWEGKPLRLSMRGDVLACANASLHCQALDIVGK
ncbi:MAG: inositol monophosphatase family protein [Pseudomonadota bacterium]